MTLTGSLLSTSISIAAYLSCETIFSLTIGSGQQYRSYHMINAMMCGQVIVMGLASLTSPSICAILGLLAGVVYSISQRIYSRYKILTNETSIIFGIMTVA